MLVSPTFLILWILEWGFSSGFIKLRVRDELVLTNHFFNTKNTSSTYFSCNQYHCFPIFQYRQALMIKSMMCAPQLRTGIQNISYIKPAPKRKNVSQLLIVVSVRACLTLCSLEGWQMSFFAKPLWQMETDGWWVSTWAADFQFCNFSWSSPPAASTAADNLPVNFCIHFVKTNTNAQWCIFCLFGVKKQILNNGRTSVSCFREREDIQLICTLGICNSRLPCCRLLHYRHNLHNCDPVSNSDNYGDGDGDDDDKDEDRPLICYDHFQSVILKC